MTTTLVYDGDCAFCSTCVRWAERLRLRADVVVPWQRTDLERLGLTQAACEEAVQWVDDQGRVSSGHVAVARLLLASAWWWRPLGLLLLAPVVSPLAARAYRWVAANRDRLPGGTAACALPAEERPPSV